MIKENSVFTVRRLDLACTHAPHPFHLACHEEAAENWQAEIARTPQLFDGPVMLASAVGINGETLSATCHIVPFSTFLLWRKRRPVPGVHHIFAMPMLIGADGRVLLGRMGAATVNAGMFYCPSGSFDPDDIVDAGFDANTNMIREVGEETGLDLRAARPEDPWHVIEASGAVVIFRRYYFSESGHDLAGRVVRFIADEPDSELAGAIGLGAGDSRPADLASHMAPILDWHFANA